MKKFCAALAAFMLVVCMGGGVASCDNGSDGGSLPTNPSNPTNPENPVAAVQDTGIYKALTSLGFDISTEKVQAVDGQYQPKMGDITSLSYRQVDNRDKYTYTYTLDRENSTENNLVYRGTCLDERHNEIEEADNNTIVVNKVEKSLDIYDSIIDTRRKFTLNDDGTLTVNEKIQNNDTHVFNMEVGANKSIYGPRGETFADIKIKLAE